MSLLCSVCGESYAPRGNDNTGYCLDCFAANFSGAQPPVGWMDEEALPRSLTLTPRQVQAMARVTERWRDRAAAEEDGA